MSALPARLFELETLALRLFFGLVGLLLLVGDFARGQHVDQLLREDHVLDVHAARLDAVFLQLLGDVILRLGLHLLPLLDEIDGRHGLQLVAEMIADGRLQHFRHEIQHGADDGDHFRRFGVGHVNLHLQVDIEDEAFFDFAVICFRPLSRLCAVDEASAQFSVRMKVGTISAE